MIQIKHPEKELIPHIIHLIHEVSYISRYLYGSTYSESSIFHEMHQAYCDKVEDGVLKNILAAHTYSGTVVGIVEFYSSDQHRILPAMQQRFSPETLNILEPFYASSLPNSTYISALIVDKTFRGQNIGEILINEVIKRAEKAGHNSLFLHVWNENVRAMAFYERLQFKKQGSIQLDTGNVFFPHSAKLWLYVRNIP